MEFSGDATLVKIRDLIKRVMKNFQFGLGTAIAFDILSVKLINLVSKSTTLLYQSYVGFGFKTFHADVIVTNT